MSIAAAQWAQLNDYGRLDRFRFDRATIRPLHVLVVGAGALGNQVVKHLGLLGIGSVTIVDPDHVEPHNLANSLFLRQAATGTSKAVALATVAGDHFPKTRFAALASEIADVGFGLISTANLVFGCVDSDLARLEIACISTRLDRPVSDGALGTPNRSLGRVSWFPGRVGACYGCTLSRRKRAELLTFWDATVRPCATPPGTTPNTSTQTMAEMTGTLQVDYGLRRYFECASTASALELNLEAPPRLQTINLSLSPACPFHATPVDQRIPAGDRNRPVRQCLQDAAPGSCLILDWPVCVDARCRACAHRWAPLLRCAKFRRSGVCPTCGSRDILELATIRAIDPASRWSELTLLDLGVPDHHLLTVRSVEP